MPRSSGLLKGGGGIRRYRRRKSAIKGWGKNFPDRMLSDSQAIREEIPDFDPALEFDYTRRELSLLAEKILLEDPKPMAEDPVVLNYSALRHRTKPEIYTSSGIADPTLTEGLNGEGMYWRTHPNGRKWATEEMRRTTGCGFYDGVQSTEREIVPPPPPPAPREVIMCIGPECDQEAVGETRQLCPGHASQFYAGRPLRPIRRIKHRVAQIRATWDSGETHAEVARRFGVSTTYVSKLRREGQADAVLKIRSGAV